MVKIFSDLIGAKKWQQEVERSIAEGQTLPAEKVGTEPHVPSGQCSRMGFCPRAVPGTPEYTVDNCRHFKANNCNWGKIDLKTIDGKAIEGAPIPRQETSGLLSAVGKALGKDQPRTLFMEDLFKHVAVLGGTGSGKTFTVLNQLLREIFRSAHIAPGELRNKLHPGMVIIEAKGDFARKLWRMGHRYGFLQDCRFIGERHETVIDLFGDPTLLPLQKADMMRVLMVAIDDGKESSDPFWNKAAMQLFSTIFIVHARLEEARQKGSSKYVPPPITFTLLYKMLNDDGRPKNRDAVDGAKEKATLAAQEYLKFLQQVADATQMLMDRETKLTRLVQAMEPAVELLTPADDLQKRAKDKWAAVGEGVLEALTTPVPLESGGDVTCTNALSGMITSVSRYLAHDPKYSHKDAAQDFANFAQVIEAAFSILTDALLELVDLIDSVQWTGELAVACTRLKDQVAALEREHGAFLSAARKLAEKERTWLELSKRQVPPEHGELKLLLAAYEELKRAEAKEKNVPFMADEFLGFLRDQVLNPNNDKMMGSVRMTAANMVFALSQAPFNRIFDSPGNFQMSEVVTKGLKVALDMPMAKYGNSQRLTAIILKLLLFRQVLSREEFGYQTDRPVFYMVDEFSSIMTSGLQTGEEKYGDKARGLGGSMIVAFQNIPQLKKQFPAEEVDGLLANMQTKIFLRNDDPETNKKASDSSGEKVKAVGQMTQSTGEFLMGNDQHMKMAHSMQFSKTAKVDPAAFETYTPGKCLVIFPPEFGEYSMRQILTFAGEPLKAAPGEPPFPGGEE